MDELEIDRALMVCLDSRKMEEKKKSRNESKREDLFSYVCLNEETKDGLSRSSKKCTTKLFFSSVSSTLFCSPCHLIDSTPRSSPLVSDKITRRLLTLIEHCLIAKPTAPQL